MCALVYSESYNNYEGLVAFQFETDAKIIIEDVTANNNLLKGMYLTGAGITAKNANLRNNGLLGLQIGGPPENEITLAGDITVTNNVEGFATPFAKGTVSVTGNLISNHNEYGVAAFSSENFTLAVGGSNSGKAGKSRSGSLTACDNSELDVDNFGGANFEGSDYTCDTTNGTNLPECKPCPGCL